MVEQNERSVDEIAALRRELKALLNEKQAAEKETVSKSELRKRKNSATNKSVENLLNEDDADRYLDPKDIDHKLSSKMMNESESEKLLKEE